MTAKNATRILFILLIAVEAIGWAGGLPWTPAFSWVGLIITAVAVWALVEWLNLPAGLWPLFFAGLFLDATADVFQLYFRTTSWDRMMHLLGGMLLAIGAWHCLKPVIAPTMPARWRTFLVIAIVALLGTLYEGMEWGVDVFYFGQPRALGDGVDTIEDQLLNLVGGLVVVGIAEYRRKR
jgi:hypothetical protein